MFAQFGNGMKRHVIRFFSVVFLLITISSGGSFVHAEGDQAAELDRLLPLVGGALVEAGQGKWAEATLHIEEAAAKWKQLEHESTKEAAAVDSALAGAAKALSASETDPDTAKASLSSLAKAFNKYV